MRSLCIHDVKRMTWVAEEVKNRDAFRIAVAINNPKAFLEAMEPKKEKAKFEDGAAALVNLMGTEKEKRKLAMRQVAMRYEKQLKEGKR